MKNYTYFFISPRANDLALIKEIQSFFNGVGKVYLQEESKVVVLRIKSLKDLAQYVIPHFDKYPLLTQKRADYLLFKQVVDLILRKEHLTSKGLLEILSIKASLNWGLPDVLKKAFPNIVPKNRPVVERGVRSPMISRFRRRGILLFCGKKCFKNTQIWIPSAFKIYY